MKKNLSLLTIALWALSAVPARSVRAQPLQRVYVDNPVVVRTSDSEAPLRTLSLGRPKGSYFENRAVEPGLWIESASARGRVPVQGTPHATIEVLYLVNGITKDTVQKALRVTAFGGGMAYSRGIIDSDELPTVIAMLKMCEGGTAASSTNRAFLNLRSGLYLECTQSAGVQIGYRLWESVYHNSRVTLGAPLSPLISQLGPP